MRENRKHLWCALFFTLLVILLSCGGPLPIAPDPNGPDPVDPDPLLPYEEISQGVFISGSLSMGPEGTGQLQIGDLLSFRTTAAYSGVMEIIAVGDSLRVKLTLYDNEGALVFDRQEKTWTDQQEIDLDGDGLSDLVWQRLPDESPIRGRNDRLHSILVFPYHPDTDVAAGFMMIEGGLGVLTGRLIDGQWSLLTESSQYQEVLSGLTDRSSRSVSFLKEGLPDLQVGDAMIVTQWDHFIGRIISIEEFPTYRTFHFASDEVDPEEYFDSIDAKFHVDLFTQMLEDGPFLKGREEEDWDFDEEWKRLMDDSSLFEKRWNIWIDREDDFSLISDSATLTTEAKVLLSGQLILDFEWRRFRGVTELRAGFGGECVFRIQAGLLFLVNHEGGGTLLTVPVPVPQPFAWLANVEAHIELRHRYELEAQGNFGIGYEGHCAQHYFLVFYDRDNGQWEVDDPHLEAEGINIFRYRRIGPNYEVRGSAEYALNVHLRPTIRILSGWVTAGLGVGPGLSMKAEASVAHDRELEANFRIGFPLEWSADIRVLFGLTGFELSGLFYDFELFRANLQFPWRPTQFVAQMSDMAMVDLTWESSSEAADGFEIQRRESSDEWDSIADLPDADLRSYTDENFFYDTPYAYRMRAYSDVEFQVFGNQIDGIDWRIPSFWTSEQEIIPTRALTIRAEVVGYTGIFGEPGLVRVSVNDQDGTWGPIAEKTAELGDRVAVEAQAHSDYAFSGWYENDQLLSERTRYEFLVEDMTPRQLQARFIKPGKMIRVEAGQFRMGNTRSDPQGEDWELPVHRIYFSYDFEIRRFPVTVSEYQRFLEHAKQNNLSNGALGIAGIHPATDISWMDAIAYCNWLSKEAGISPAYDLEGNLLDAQGFRTEDTTKVMGYRLPTEAEWEYTARGGHLISHDFLYAGSDLIDEVGWYEANSDGHTHPTGRLASNDLHAYDMSGNVNEWVYDRWDPDYYKEGSKINPIGPHPPTDRRHVLRGGSWDHSARHCRISARYHAIETYHDGTTGLRVARTIEESVVPVLIEVELRPDDHVGELRIGDRDWGAHDYIEAYPFLPVVVEARRSNLDYVFMGWYEENKKEWVSYELEYTFYPTEEQALQGWFKPAEPNTATITLETIPAHAGEVRIDGGEWATVISEDVAVGSMVDIEARAHTEHGSRMQTQYRFDGWYIGDQKVSDQQLFSFEAQLDQDYQARFVEDLPGPHAIRAESDPKDGGWIRFDIGEGWSDWNIQIGILAEHGQEVIMEAQEKIPERVFKGWFDGMTQIAPNRTYKFHAYEEKNIRAVFQEIDFQDLKNEEEVLIEGQKATRVYYRFDDLPYWMDGRMHTHNVAVKIHNKFADDLISTPEILKHVEFYVGRDRWPTLHDYDYRSGELELDGKYARKWLFIKQVEPLDSLYILVHGLDKFEVGLIAIVDPDKAF